MNRNVKVKQRKPNLSRQGENFAGLQTYIISEIDSGSDQEGKQRGTTAGGGKNNLGFLSDASSFSNSDSSDGAAALDNQNSSCSDEAEEQHDVIFGAMQGTLPKNSQSIN